MPVYFETEKIGIILHGLQCNRPVVVKESINTRWELVIKLDSFVSSNHKKKSAQVIPYHSLFEICKQNKVILTIEILILH